MGPILALASATIIVGPSLFWIIILPESEVTLPLSLKLQALMAITLGATLGWALNYLIFNYSS
jgi:membrane protein YqaA with SNARE-associated domain